MAVPSPSYHTSKPPGGCHCGAVTELTLSWGALGLERSSSAFEASLHPSPDGSAQSESRVGWAGHWDCYFKAQPNQ